MPTKKFMNCRAACADAWASRALSLQTLTTGYSMNRLPQLTSKHANRSQGWLRSELRRRQIAALLVTHDLDDVGDFADAELRLDGPPARAAR